MSLTVCSIVHSENAECHGKNHLRPMLSITGLSYYRIADVRKVTNAAAVEWKGFACLNDYNI